MRPWLAAAALALTAPAAAMTPEQEAMRKAAVSKLFDLDFARSRAGMRELINTDPANPLGFLFEGGMIWWQSSVEYGLFKDTPTLEGLFEADIDECIDKAKPLMDSKDPASENDGLFAAGMCYGVRGQWNLARGRYVKALRDGRKAVKHLKKCVARDPDYHDAYLGLGIFDYQTDRLPAVLKVPALFMIRGDAERGKARMRQAVERGRLVSRQAAIFLMSLLITDEKDYAGAMALLEGLQSEYPRSPYFQFARVVLLHKLGRDRESIHEARALFARSKSDPEILGRKLLATLCGLTADKCLEPPTLADAGAWLDAALAREPEDAGTLRAPRKRRPGAPRAERGALEEERRWRAFLELLRGLTHDMSGEREAALPRYRAVLALPETARSHERARRCLEAPCPREAVSAMLRELSLKDDGPAAAGLVVPAAPHGGGDDEDD